MYLCHFVCIKSGLDDRPVNYTFGFGPGLVNCSWDGPGGAKMPTQLHDNRGFVPPDMTHVSEMF